MPGCTMRLSQGDLRRPQCFLITQEMTFPKLLYLNRVRPHLQEMPGASSAFNGKPHSRDGPLGGWGSVSHCWGNMESVGYLRTIGSPAATFSLEHPRQHTSSHSLCSHLPTGLISSCQAFCSLPRLSSFLMRTWQVDPENCFLTSLAETLVFTF